MSFGAGGMGFEGYSVKSIEDFKGVDWLTEDLEIETVPVYQNVEFLHEGISTVLNPDLDRMKAIIDDLAQRLNVDYEELVAREDNGIIYAYEVSDSKISIEVNSLMEAEINFKEELVLPENIHNGYDDSYEEIAAYGEYCMDEFSYLWDEELELVVSGGDYNIYDEQSFDTGAQNDKMKVSLANLLLLINQKEKEVSELHNEVIRNSMVIKDREIDGRETVLNEVQNFDSLIKDYFAVCDELTKYKNLLAKNNASVILESGITIIEAINVLSILRKKLYLFDILVTKKPSLDRKSDGNGISSYYRVNDLNFNLELVKHDRLSIQDHISKLESEIQKANNENFVEI